MEFKVKVSLQALQDAEQAMEWIARRSPRRAAKWCDDLFAAFDSLQSLPRRCPLSPESVQLGREIRQLCYGKRRGVYRILFEVRGSTVHILRVRHSAQKWLDPELPS